MFQISKEPFKCILIHVVQDLLDGPIGDAVVIPKTHTATNINFIPNIMRDIVKTVLVTAAFRFRILSEMILLLL